jgi:hypothetical protein
MTNPISGKQICSNVKPMEYFREKVNSAVEELHVDVDEMVVFYLVNLLSEFHKIEKVTLDVEPKADEEALSILFEKALFSNQNEQIRRFKHLGDFSLFISGFFPDSIYKRLVNHKFYMSIGSIAYTQLANIMRTKAQSKTFWELYQGLAKNFSAFVDVLSEVSGKSMKYSNKNILKIYERWLKRKNPGDEKILRNEGISINFADANNLIH